MCDANKWCIMLEREIEILNGKKRSWLFSHKHVVNLWMVLPVFSRREITVISCQFTSTLKTIITGYCS